MIDPYYQDDLVTLYHGDALEVTEWQQADVLVTDPPYGMSFRSGRRKEKLAPIAGDRDTEVRDAVLAAWGDKPALAFGRWSVAAPAGERQRLIWWKQSAVGMGDLRLPWGPAHEDIHVLGTGWDKAAAGVKRSGSVIATSAGRGGAHGAENETGHPTPKPVGLMEQLIMRTPPPLDCGRPVRGIGRDAHRGPQPRTTGNRRGAGRALLRGHREATRATGIRLFGAGR